jgi:hypothetical protein
MIYHFGLEKIGDFLECKFYNLLFLHKRLRFEALMPIFFTKNRKILTSNDNFFSTKNRKILTLNPRSGKEVRFRRRCLAVAVGHRRLLPDPAARKGLLRRPGVGS